MPFSIDDSTNPADTRTNLNLVQSLNAIAFVLKRITGQSSWKVPPPLSMTQLGEKGDTGAQGAQGLKGDTGTQGAQGAQGLKGDKGDTGTQGAQGLKGDKGDTGTQGAQGLKGDKGDTGVTGAQGIQGLKGDKGDKGDTGVTGAQGIQGLKGDTGATGAAASVSPQAWTDLTLSTNWINNGGNSSTAQCRKVVGSLVEVKGTIKKTSSLVAGEVVATLPIGYTPVKDSYFITWNTNGQCRLQLGSDGTLRASATTSNTAISLNIIFGLD